MSILSIIHRTSRLKISKAREDLNTVNQPDHVDIYKTFHPKIPEYSLFSMAYGM